MDVPPQAKAWSWEICSCRIGVWGRDEHGNTMCEHAGEVPAIELTFVCVCVCVLMTERDICPLGIF